MSDAVLAPEDHDAQVRRAMLHVLEDLQRERDAHRDAHRQWIDTVDAVRDPLMVHDRDGRILRANRAYAQRAGVDVVALVGQPYWQCFPRLDARPAGESAEGEFVVDDRTFVSHVHPVAAKAGAPAAWLHLFEDVTEKRNVQEQQLRSLRRAQAYSTALETIASSVALLDGEVEKLAHEITEAVCHATGVERANVWLFNEAESELRCIDAYEATPARHSAGMVLNEAQFHNEFDALKRAACIAADDPLTDPRTAGYVEPYLKPLGITSMLDAVVRISGKSLGLLCLEHVGRPHHWDPDEIAFACHLADKIAVALSNRDRRLAQRQTERGERYFRKLIEGSTDAFIVVDAKGKVLYRSESGARLTGYPTEQVVGQSIAKLMAPQSVTLAREALARRLAHPEVSGRVEMQLQHKDGRLVDVEVSGKNLIADPDVGGIVVTLHDISERKRAENRIQTLNTLYATLSAVNHAVVQSKSRREISDRIVRISTEVGVWQGAWIGFVEPGTQRIRMEACSESILPFLHEIDVSIDAALPQGQGPAGNALRNTSPYFCDDVTEAPAGAPWRRFAAKFGVGTVAAIPLLVSGGDLGVLLLYSREKGIFTPEVRSLVIELGDDVTYAVEMLDREGQRELAEAALAEHQAKLRRSLEATIEAIAATVETRDPYTAGHQRRVADLAQAIGREMGLSEDAQQGLHFGALIHDLGKVQVPAEILSKPTRLSKLEFELIKTHSQAGYDIVKGIDFPWPVAAMVHQHHERFDGSGYPQGLKGEAIALEARILAVADVVEAMASHRPYRPGLGIEAALKEIETKRGIWFDPRPVDACLALFREKRFAWSDGGRA